MQDGSDTTTCTVISSFGYAGDVDIDAGSGDTDGNINIGTSVAGVIKLAPAVTPSSQMTWNLAGFGEWAISNGTAGDTCRVDDYAEYDYVPSNGDNVYVRGVVAYTIGNYKIEPRGNEDIAANPTGVSDDYFGGKFGLAQNMPNPFNPETRIAFNLTAPGDVTLEIYDVAGRTVATLLDRHMDAGAHVAHWDGRTSDGERAASGVYFYKLAAGDQNVSRKMVLLK